MAKRRMMRVKPESDSPSDSTRNEEEPKKKRKKEKKKKIVAAPSSAQLPSTGTIVGIDPGSRCGWACCSNGEIMSGMWDTRVKLRKEGGGMRYLRLEKQMNEFFDKLDEKVDCLFFEEVRRHKGVDAAHVYGGVVATITKVCEQREIPYASVPVGTVKKRATGKGNAGKEDMVAAANREFGLGLSDKENDRADALWILVCGIEEVG